MSTGPEGRPGSPSAPPGFRCVVCHGLLSPAVTRWTFRCPECGTWRSSLQPAVNQETVRTIDDRARVAGLEALRRANFRLLFDRIATCQSLAGSRLLDVGCAYGWFLEEAAERGAEAVGVEPDEAIAAQASARGLEVRVGWFPAALDVDEQFDIIAFNDVFEHLVDVRGALASCAQLLRPNGLLSINIPSADGLGYRVATLLARMGVIGPFERFWQAGLPSPHTHYFPRRALTRLVQDERFLVRSVAPLRAIASEGLWARVHMVRSPSPASVVSYAGLRLAAPMLNHPRASDIIQLIAGRP